MDENERTEFPLSDGTMISYAAYRRSKYGVSALYRERCVIKDRGGAAFLPQFINITATNEMLGNEGIDEIREQKAKMSPHQRMEDIRKFIKTANDRVYSLKEGFETSSRPLNCKAEVL